MTEKEMLLWGALTRRGAAGYTTPVEGSTRNSPACITFQIYLTTIIRPAYMRDHQKILRFSFIKKLFKIDVFFFGSLPIGTVNFFCFNFQRNFSKNIHKVKTL